MGIAARLIDSKHDDQDLRVGPTFGGAIEFSLAHKSGKVGEIITYLVITHDRLDEVIDFCDRAKQLAIDLKAIENPK